MKKWLFGLAAATYIMVACNKEASVSSSLPANSISVTATSALMNVSASALSADDSLVIYFEGSEEDSICWLFDGDSSYGHHEDHHGHDSTGHDSTWYGDGDSIHIFYGDSLDHFEDSLHHPYDSSFVHNDSTNCRNLDSAGYHKKGHYMQPGFTITVNGNKATLRVLRTGNYMLTAKAYARNSDGSYTLVKSGYIKLTAR